ncbi:TraB/GumN family protein [Eionea flava]
MNIIGRAPSQTIYSLVRCIFCFLFVACFSQTSVGQDKSPVWKISHEGNVLYLGGTIHALAESDYPLPSGFDTAYSAANVLVLETDIEKMQSPEAQGLLVNAMLYQDGRTLSRVLSSEVYQQLAQFIAQRGGDIAQFETFKPGMLSILLTLDEVKRLNQLGEGVDSYYDKRAQRDGKTRLFLETVEQQLNFLAAMGEGQEDHFMRYSLEELNNTSAMLQQLKHAWRSGNESTLETVGISEWRNDFPRLYQSLLVQRNNAWLPQLDAMLNTAPTEAVFVGALHLVGEEGLLTQLRKRGYIVEQLP